MAGNQYLGDYYVDIVMCIDATGSMDPIIEEIKKNAKSFYLLLVNKMEENNKKVDQLRIKVILFRDYCFDDEPMVESKFFVLPDQNDEFKNFVDRIYARGGGDEPENALEAIALALKSDWTTEGTIRRHFILVFTDAPATKLGERDSFPGYPQKIPQSLDELSVLWEGIDQTLCGSYQPKAGRLVAFVPVAEPWIELQSWNRYWPIYSQANTGLSDVDIQTVIDMLVGSF